MKQAVICARVSTDLQAEQGRSIQSQLAAMRQYAQLHDMVVIAELTDDISGTTPIRQRPGGAQLYTYIDQRKADAVIFYTVDRVTRDEDLIEINVLRRDIRNAVMELHYANDGGKADLSTLGGMIDTMKSAFAAEERRKIIERNMRGRMAKAQAGRWVGEGFAPFGYRKVGKLKEARLEIDPVQAAVVRRIFDLYLGRDGQAALSISQIGELLSKEDVPRPQRGQYWGKRTIRLILTRTAYIGRFEYRGVTINLPELTIIDPVTFEATQQRLAQRRSEHGHNKKNFYLVSGRIRCRCGRAMSGRLRYSKNGKGHYYYACSSAFLPSVARTCREPSVRTDVVDASIWDWLLMLLSDDAQISEGLDEMAERRKIKAVPSQIRLTEIAAQVERAEKKLRRLVSSYGDADENELQALRDEAKQTSRAIDALKAERLQLQAIVDKAGQEADYRTAMLNVAAELRAGLAEADNELRRYTLEQLNVQVQIVEEGGEYFAEACCDLGGDLWAIATTDPRNDTLDCPQFRTRFRVIARHVER